MNIKRTELFRSPAKLHAPRRSGPYKRKRSLVSKRLKVLATVVGAVLATSALAAIPAGAAASKAANATSAKAVGGLAGLIKLAKAEKELNIIACPDDWSNYGELKAGFTKKYGIKVNSYDEQISSAAELVAAKTLKGQSRQPDVVDIGIGFTAQGINEGLFSNYKVLTWNDIAPSAKGPNGEYTFDYGGFVSIGYDAKRVSPAPTSIKDLLNPAYKGQVALNGNPATAGAASSAVIASIIANGGSIGQTAKGLAFWKKLKAIGNFIPVEATPATVQSGTTPITLDWDYLQATYAKESNGKVDWKVVIPSDVAYQGGYAIALIKDSPHPAAARLWAEYLFSDEGQNLWLKGGSRVIRLDAMIKAGTANKAYIASLPPIPAGAKPVSATAAQVTSAKARIAAFWGKL